MLIKGFIIVNHFVNCSTNNLKAPVMKKLILCLAVLFSVNTMLSQDCAKTCDMAKTSDTAHKYVMSNGLIEATLFHDNGKIAQTGFYTKENKLHGAWVSFDTNGNKTAEAHYNNGKKVGTWFFFQGNAQKEVVYNDSKIAQVRTWEVTDTRVVSNRR